MAPNSPVVALLSIKPIYANAILDGIKKVEFRKRAFKRQVSHVVIYATTPVQRIVGWFRTKNLEQMSPSALWKRFATVGGISKDDFNTYYRGSESGVAIHVDCPRRLANPISIKRIKITVAPQSFTYLSLTILDRLIADKAPPKRLVAKRARRGAQVKGSKVRRQKLAPPRRPSRIGVHGVAVGRSSSGVKCPAYVPGVSRTTADCGGGA